MRYNNLDFHLRNHSPLSKSATIRFRNLSIDNLEYLATHDELTGLPNKALFYDRLAQAIHHAERGKNRFALLFIDLDRFKRINDCINHKAGDQVLRIAAQRILATVRASDTLGRFGGDEFLLLIQDVDKREALIPLVKAILERLSQGMDIANQDIALAGSIGIALYPDNGRTIEELICNADTAMYKSKELGGNQFQFHTTNITRNSLKLLTMECELRQAIQKKQFSLDYQAQYDSQTGTLLAVEALVRWNHPGKGEILPLEFIPLAEESGLIIPLGEWILEEACRQNKAWQEAGLKKIRVAVNISARQLRQPNFVHMVTNSLQLSNLAPEYLELELSENTVFSNSQLLEILSILKKIGVKTTIHDFGTGYTSMQYLKDLPLDRLKIDKAFIKNIHVNKVDEVFIHTIIRMAQELQLPVLAEGVETLRQLQFLHDKHCFDIQGYYFGKPLSAEKLAGVMEKLRKD